MAGWWEELAWWVRGQRDPRSLAFDAAWGTETARFDLFNYEPCLPEAVGAALDALDVGPSGWTFLDLGSGKGRAVLIASRRGFARAVGVERRRALHRRALANLEAFQARGGARCPVELVLGDAETCPLPEGPLVVYLYNPFPAPTVRAVLARLVGREHRLVYLRPKEAEVVEAAGYRAIAGGEDPEYGPWRVYTLPGAPGAG